MSGDAATAEPLMMDAGLRLVSLAGSDKRERCATSAPCSGCQRLGVGWARDREAARAQQGAGHRQLCPSRQRPVKSTVTRIASRIAETAGRHEGARQKDGGDDHRILHGILAGFQGVANGCHDRRLALPKTTHTQELFRDFS